MLEILTQLVHNQEFAESIQRKIDTKIDLTEITKELNVLEKNYKKAVAIKDRLINARVALDPLDKHFERKFEDLENQIDAQYDLMVGLQEEIDDCRRRKQNQENDQLTVKQIYSILVSIDKMYAILDDEDKKRVFQSLIEEIHVYPEKQGKRWIKSICFKFPLVGDETEISLDTDIRASEARTEPPYDVYCQEKINKQLKNFEIRGFRAKFNYLELPGIPFLVF